MKLADLSSRDTETIKRGIKFFDTSNSGSVKTSQLGNLLRYLKLIPSNDEIEQIMEILDPNNTGSVSNVVLLHAIAELWPSHPNELEQRVWSAFLAFDKLDQGVLTVEEFRLILTGVGHEPIPEHEVKKIIRDFSDPKTGKVPYGNVIRTWMK
ncbi:Calmodulin-2 [Fasciola hepatica]|uniref:Calmodulin-2 n=1 Tax=Fasciola hepatica TaxID=6192 RepID=A0A2H1CJT3_FASHE|nr:Calmodulin-2 [Fasciola hepatica]